MFRLCKLLTRGTGSLARYFATVMVMNLPNEKSYIHQIAGSFFPWTTSKVEHFERKQKYALPKESRFEIHAFSILPG